MLYDKITKHITEIALSAIEQFRDIDKVLLQIHDMDCVGSRRILKTGDVIGAYKAMKYRGWITLKRVPVSTKRNAKGFINYKWTWKFTKKFFIDLKLKEARVVGGPKTQERLGPALIKAWKKAKESLRKAYISLKDITKALTTPDTFTAGVIERNRKLRDNEPLEARDDIPIQDVERYWQQRSFLRNKFKQDWISTLGLV